MLNFDFKPGPEQILNFFRVLLVIPKESSLLSQVSPGCKAFNLDPFPLFTIELSSIASLFLSLFSAPPNFHCLPVHLFLSSLPLPALLNFKLSFLEILAQYSLLQVIALFDKYFLKHPNFTFMFVQAIACPTRLKVFEGSDHFHVSSTYPKNESFQILNSYLNFSGIVYPLLSLTIRSIYMY